MANNTVALLIVSAAMLGCHAPSSITAPTGAAWDQQAMQSLEGTWGNRDGEVLIARLSDDGELHIAMLEFDRQSGQYELIAVDVSLTRVDGYDFAFVKIGYLPNYYFWLVSRVDQSEIRIRQPSHVQFVEAIRNDGSLGEIKEGGGAVRAVVKGEEQVLLKIVEQYGIDTCFPQDEEVILHRVVPRKLASE